VRVLDNDVTPDGEQVVTMVAVDPVTETKLGDPFSVMLTRTLADRLAAYERRGELGLLVLRGTLIPDVQINEDRPERGSFDKPLFIGPFAEFGYTIEVKSLLPVADDKLDHKEKNGSSTKDKRKPDAGPTPR
jgi:hypothetical protein